MKRAFLLSVVALHCLQVISQVPQGINYQAVIHNSAGAPVANTTLQVKAGILSDTITPVIVWEELHPSVRTDASGLFSLVIGTGTKQSGSAATFSAVDWSMELFIKIQVYYQNSWKSLGTAKLWSVPYALKANDFNGTVNKLTVEGETTDMEEALFEVKNKDGQTVFAVYNEGVRIYVDDGAKGAKGGFAIGGFGTTKEPSQDLLVVTPDCVRVYIDKKTDKAPKGGFAIGGFGTVKGPTEEYLRITRDSTRIYLNDTISKGPKGGFAIGGFGTTKGIGSEYMSVAPGNTRFYVRTLADASSSTFNIIGLDQNQAEVPLLMANKDTIEVSGVLNLQNDLIVDGNVSVSGVVSQDSVTMIKDADGNYYDTVKIGNQIWMKENLKTSKFNDGTPIPNVKDQTTWIGLTTGARCYYNNDSTSNAKTYGALYNWYAINTGKLCPSGWHVSTDAEWHEMILRYDNTASLPVNGWESATAAQSFKEAGTTHWSSPNVADNASRLTILPAGVRHVSSFMMINDGTRLWAGSSSSATEAYNRGFAFDNSVISRNVNDKALGFSVRCIQNQPVPTDGLVAYYPFNGNANDESGNGLNGTATGVTYVDSKTDKAVTLTSTSAVQIVDNSLLDFSSATGVTIAARIRQEQGVNGYVLIKMGSGGSSDDEYSFSVAADGIVQGAFNSPVSNKSIPSNKKLSLNVWYNVVLMWEKSTGDISIYIDGVLDNKVSSSVTSVQNTTVSLIVGDPNMIVAAHSMVGSIDELRIYSRVLSESEIPSLMNK